MNTLQLKSVNMIEIIGSLLLRKGSIAVTFDDNSVVDMPVRKLIFHLIFWNVGRKWGVPITPKFIIKTELINSNTISEIGTLILREIVKRHNTYHESAFDFGEAINTLNQFVINNCQEYHKSMSIIDLIQIANIPEIRAITDDKVTDPMTPMREAERKIETNSLLLFKELKKPHPGNTLYPFIHLRFIKETQLAHIFYQVGYRTDIDDSVFRYPVSGNYLDGLKNITEYVLESLSAKKSSFYNKYSLPITEYFGRRQHILLAALQYLYPGDCGSTITMPLRITERMRNAVLFKNIVVGSQIITLTEDNVDNYLGEVVQFRTPMGCRHRDGVCMACGGKLISNITPNTHVGIFSAQQATNVITQSILSNKHVQSIRAIEYVIPAEFLSMFRKSQSYIFAKPTVADKLKNVKFIITKTDAMHLLGISDFQLGNLNNISESAFGICRSLAMIRDNTVVFDQESLESNSQFPLYSKYLIKYIADHPELVGNQDDVFYVDMKLFDFTKPLFKLIIMNNSMVKFVNNAKMLLENKIGSYTSATALINDFTDLVYGQVHANIVYLEIILRAAMISGNYDYRIPIVEDIDKVKFTSNLKINMYRSLGMLCAFERAPAAFDNPLMYIMPKTYTKFCDFLNLKPKHQIK